MQGTGFIIRTKKRWDQHFPKKATASKQTLRDNAIRFKKELEQNRVMEGNRKGGKERRENDENDATYGQIIVNLVTIERDEGKEGKGFMQRMMIDIGADR